MRYLRATPLGPLHAEAVRTRTDGVKTYCAGPSPTPRASRWRPRACSSRRAGCATEEECVMEKVIVALRNPDADDDLGRADVRPGGRLHYSISACPV